MEAELLCRNTLQKKKKKNIPLDPAGGLACQVRSAWLLCESRGFLRHQAFGWRVLGGLEDGGRMMSGRGLGLLFAFGKGGS